MIKVFSENLQFALIIVNHKTFPSKLFVCSLYLVSVTPSVHYFMSNNH